MEPHEIEQAWVRAGAVVRRGTKGNVLSATFASLNGSDAEPPTPIPPLLELLASWKKLRALDLTGIPVDDRLGSVLITLNDLQELTLVGTRVSDEVLGGLSNLTQLKIVDVTGTSVSPEALARERKRLIRVRIIKRD